ncbi:ABC transporter ATP-binding protein [Methyloraptor flagellatus]|jgi:iron(III) transport system ATP-binding protein|uniref:ABC transporter ATP-binding protein n=1 Tax=Methyloraptor flagellatus TaxID=3162530 RepID=A0AAU7XCA2_9HYPH
MNQIVSSSSIPAPAGAARGLPPALEFHQVVKRYGLVTAVAGVDFTVDRGTLVTLLGPSGCGKTTTLRLVAGLELPTTGQIRIDGTDVTFRSAAERDVSMVFQSYALFPHMSVLENVCYGLRASGVGKARAVEMAAEKLATVGLAGFEKRLPSELSGGQQQRVAVARAIVLEPKVLLFDEPLSNLDAKLRRRVREDIRQLQQQLGLTVIYVTHDQEEALAVSDRIIVMRNARIVQDGTPRDLYERPADRFIADFIGNANLVPVEVTRDDSPLARVSLDGMVLALPHRDLPAGRLDLAVRPNAFLLRAGGPQPGEIAGTIRKAAYLGSHMEYELVLPGIDRELFVVDPGVERPFEPGAVVGVRIAPHGAALVPADGGAA